MTIDPQGQAQKLREEGNAFYKQGKYVDAIEKYFDAVHLVPDDPLPRANLSAAFFEEGKYEYSVLFGASALRITKTDNDADLARRERLVVRMRKCFVLAQTEPQEWGDPWEKMADETRDLVLEMRSQLSELKAQPVDPIEARKAVADRIPRYRPWMQNEQEYFAFGHDCARPEYNDLLLKHEQPDVTAFMFCGVGDARNFYATLAKIHSHTKKKPGLKDKRYHFTLFDLKPAMMARNLIIFCLLDDLSRQEKDTQEETDTMLILYYTWAGVIMPAYAYEGLQKAISQVVLGLRNDLMPKWFRVPPQILPRLIRELEGWSRGIDDQYPTGVCRQLVIEHQQRGFMHRKMAMIQHLGDTSMDYDDSPEGCEVELPVFRGTGHLLAPKLLMAHKEPAYGNLVKGFVDPEILFPYIDSHWRPNPTFVDIEWQKVRDDLGKDPDFAANPFDMPDQFFNESEMKRPKNPLFLFDYFLAFFRPVAQALAHLHDRMIVEMFVGEMSDILERLQHGILEQRNALEAAPPPGMPKAPTLYHRIHMSNVPDYTGGLLCSFLYALPALDRAQASGFCSTVLRNPPAFSTTKDFTTEYCAVSETTEVYSLFETLMNPTSPCFISPHPLPMAEYLYWMSMPPGMLEAGLGYGCIDTHRLEKFLSAMFLKLVLPFPRDTRGNNLIYSPLNAASFLKLLEVLCLRDNQAHRICEALNSILSNDLVTTARAPRSSPLSMDESNRDFARQKIDIKPFLAEFSTLAAIWRNIMPFGYDHESLPLLENIAEYRVKLGQITEGVDFNVPHSGLLFWNSDVAALPKKNLRKLLLDDEKGNRSKTAVEVRDHGAHVLSTFDWDSRTQNVTFWLRHDVVKEMQNSGNWNLYFLRTDLWVPASEAVAVKSLDSMRSWTDCES